MDLEQQLCISHLAILHWPGMKLGNGFENREEKNPSARTHPTLYLVNIASIAKLP